jgi:hypothetical protein
MDPGDIKRAKLKKTTQLKDRYLGIKSKKKSM